MSLATEVLDAFRRVAAAAEGTPFARQALADAEHIAALVPKEADAAASAVAESEEHVLAWLAKRLHPEAAEPAVPPAKPAPEPAPVPEPAASTAKTGGDTKTG